jgi:hypothetical protein
MIIFASLLTACGNGKDAAIGEYQFYSMQTEGMTADADYLKRMGIDISEEVFMIKDDGTFELNVLDETATGNWEKSGDEYSFTTEQTADISVITGKYDSEEKTMTLTYDSPVEVSIVLKK